MTVEQLINELKNFPPQTIFGGAGCGYGEMNDSGDVKLETLDEVQYPNGFTSAHFFVEPKPNHASHVKFIKRGDWVLLG